MMCPISALLTQPGLLKAANSHYLFGSSAMTATEASTFQVQHVVSVMYMTTAAAYPNGDL